MPGSGTVRCKVCKATSQNRKVRLVLRVWSVPPSFGKCGNVSLCNTQIGCRVATSQTVTGPPSPEVTSSLLSGENEGERFTFVKTASTGLGVVLQSITVSSLPPVASVWPSGANATAHTSLPWPMSFDSSFPVVTFQRRTV